MSTTPPPDAIGTAADRIQEAIDSHSPVAPIRDLIAPLDAAAAYRVQELLTARRLESGARIVGRKIGLTSKLVQKQLGVDQPDFGVLFDDMKYADGATVPVSRLLQPKVEAEIAFILAEDIDGGDIDAGRARAAVAAAVPALEIVDSRIVDWDITFADTVADNASSGLFVLGGTEVSLANFAPIEAEMTMSLDGEVVSTGSGSACLGDPLEALAWLARTASELGSPLRAGQVILSGALGPMVPVTSGSTIHAEITGLGTVSAIFDEAHEIEDHS